MKLPLYGLGWALAASVAWAADPTSPAPRPEWKGMIDLDPGRSFLVVAPGETGGNWEKVGDTFGDWTVTSYRAADHILTVQRRDGTKLELVMNESPAAAAAPLAAPAPSDIALIFLQQRATQLQREAARTAKEYEAFKKEHDGMDPAQMRPSAIADEGNELHARMKAAHESYIGILEKLAERQRERRAAGLPPTLPAN